MEAGDNSAASEIKTSETMSENQVSVEEEEEELERKVELGPQFSLKEQIEMDKVSSH